MPFEEPGWEVAIQGQGRWLRRADIAAALTRRDVRDASGMREGEGSQVLAQGLAGAIGLLCVGDVDGLKALSALLDHGADTATQALAASKMPVGPAVLAQDAGCYAQYGPLAMLSLAVVINPRRYTALADEARTRGDAAAAIRAVFPAEADAVLGAPRSADLHVARRDDQWAHGGEHWEWKEGGWRTADGPAKGMALAQSAAGLTTVGDVQRIRPTSNALLVVPLLAYDRSPKDNISVSP